MCIQSISCTMCFNFHIRKPTSTVDLHIYQVVQGDLVQTKWIEQPIQLWKNCHTFTHYQSKLRRSACAYHYISDKWKVSHPGKTLEGRGLEWIPYSSIHHKLNPVIIAIKQLQGLNTFWVLDVNIFQKLFPLRWQHVFTETATILAYLRT